MRASAKLLLARLWGVLYAPVLDADVQLFWRDTQRSFYPCKLAIAERLKRGELPPSTQNTRASWSSPSISIAGGAPRSTDACGVHRADLCALGVPVTGRLAPCGVAGARGACARGS
jgi:hypothetical protein